MPVSASELGVDIVRLSALGRDAQSLLRPAIEAIFFEASGREFASGPERATFQERWLGRYLEQIPEATLLARDGDGRVLGYVVGSWQDPAADPRFADHAYFRDFAALTACFPAHLHINLAPQARNRGIGGHLVEAFAVQAKGAGAAGLHVVTGERARNRDFYARLGFAQLGAAQWNGNPIVLLGRAL